jgi:carboxymethylenebutenolidase
MVGVALAVSSSALAQDWAKANLAKSPRHGEFVTISGANGRPLQLWVVYPEVKGKAPVVVMIHEIFGMSDWAREMADELAGAGYIVVEPDLLSGLGPQKMSAEVQRAPHMEFAAYEPQNQMPQQYHGEHPGLADAQNAGAPYVEANPGGTSAFPPDQVTRAVSSLPDMQVLGDLDAAADYGKKLPAANGKLFVAGFCWGGGKTFLFATHRKDLSGAFVFYGPPPPENLMKNITAPVYGFYAGNDARITATVPKTQDTMKGLGKTYEPVTYDGAGHGFMRAGEAPDASAANSAARQAGFKRLVELMGGVH